MNQTDYDDRAMGMRPIAIDGGEEKKKLCLSMGAEAFVDFKEEKDVAAKVSSAGYYPYLSDPYLHAATCANLCPTLEQVVEIADGIGAHGVLVTAYQAYKGK